MSEARRPAIAFAPESVTLANGTEVSIRALGSGEDEPVRELLVSLDPVSWYLRFLSPYPTALDSLVPLLTDVDDGRRVTLVAEHRMNGSIAVIGMANLAVSDNGDAELGVVVRCSWQRQRLGTELAARALGAADRVGASQFVSYVASWNTAGRRLLAKVGIVRSVQFAGRVSEYWFARRSWIADQVVRPDVPANQAPTRCTSSHAPPTSAMYWNGKPMACTDG